MPTFYGNDAQDYLTARTNGQRKWFRMANDLVIWKDTYEFAGTESANDEILLSREFPAGSIVIPVLSRVHTVTQPAADALVADLGINGVADNILDGVAINTVGIVTPATREIEIVEASRPVLTLKTVTGAVTAGREIDFYFALRQTS